MIIIKCIFLYFIQITHTDDFPSTGRLPTSTQIIGHIQLFQRLWK